MSDIFLLSHRIAKWAAAKGQTPALIFLDNGEQPTATVTYDALHQQAQQIAAQLLRRGLTGERILLLFPSGIDYVLSFVACLYAGAIAVPSYPPRNNWHVHRTLAIASNAGAKCILTSAKLLAGISLRLAEASITPPDIIAIDALDDSCGTFTNVNVRSQDPAYLQYTSGSTGDPKGVIVRHADLATNCSMYNALVGLHQGETFVSWLPIFHDMGLVQGIVMPLVLGGAAVFMPPAAFIQTPGRWLRAIDRYRAVFSGAPNFAYDLCVRKVSDNDAAALDLSAWRIAINGAEPLSYNTFRTFCNKFRVSGFREEALFGAYGLAEATLIVSTTKPGERAPVLYVDKPALQQDRIELRQPDDAQAVPIVSCGVPTTGFDTRIVDPQTGRECHPGAVGEIWLSGGSLGAGYWGRPQETEETFGATLDTVPGARFLHTGDLGFVSDNHLYLTGRLKDLIIIRGANHYPQDIEKVAESVDPALRIGGWGAAFTVERDGVSSLVMVQEVERSARHHIDAQDVGHRIARTISESDGIEVDIVVLVDPGSVPKTSSGKIQRQACRQLFLADELREIGRWQRPAIASQHNPLERPRNERDLTEWLCAVIAGMSGVSVAQVSPDEPFSVYGLDSARMVELVGEVGSALERPLPATLAFEYPTIALLATYLVSGSTVSAVSESSAYAPIAVIGLNCRFPGADGPDAFWQLLESGAVAISEITAARRDLTGYQVGADDPFQWAGFLSDIEYFDAALFGISPREAEGIDPQQRFLLETTWSALESANIAPDSLVGSLTGVFIGISTSDYFRLRAKTTRTWDAYAGTGGAMSVAANRISYCLGLQGPSMSIDTACSSSLVALHQACRSLGNGETHLAIAGGVNLILSEDYGAIFTQAQMLSPVGRCRTFDDAADGYVRGEGCGVVVLKRLADARRDGDRVLAVICGSAVNQDGFSSGLTVPNGRAQERVIRTALRCADFESSTIGYVETHGTGTPLGDPIEVRSLRAVFDGDAGAGSPCWLGAVKPNIGHLESAAGIAGLIKAILVLEHGVIPAISLLQNVNRNIDLSNSRLQLPTTNTPWPAPAGYPRRAGVSSFGFGGTNAHVVLEAFPQETPVLPPPPNPATVSPSACVTELLAITANSAASLAALARAYAERLERIREPGELASLCRTANTARAMLPERLTVLGTDPSAIATALHDDARTRQIAVQTGVIHGRAVPRPKIAFLFTGQGSQYAGMGAELDRDEPVFRDCLSQYEEILRGPLGVSLRAVLYGEHIALLDDTRYAQPVLVALQLALVALWEHWGITATYVAGHSVGEYSAACVAGILDVETTLGIVVERGRLMASAPGQGAMASVRAPAEAVRRSLAQLPDVEVAAINAPDQVVISGTVAAVDAALAVFQHQQIDATRLRVSHAFHSKLMEPLLPEFRRHLDDVAFGIPQLPMIKAAADSPSEPTSSHYWIDQLRGPVHFATVLTTLQAREVDAFVEIGPSPVLIGLGRRSNVTGTCVSSLQPGQDGRTTMRTALGTLFTIGASANLNRLGEGNSGAFVDAPCYPFDRARYWFPHEVLPANALAGLPYVGRPLNLASTDVVAFEAILPQAGEDFLRDHRVCGRSILPAAGYVSMMLSAARYKGIGAETGVLLRGLQLLRRLDLDEQGVRVQTVMRRIDGTATWNVEIAVGKNSDQPWETCATATLEPATATSIAATPTPFQETAQTFAAQQLYEQFRTWGLEYGPAFRGCGKVTFDGKRAQAVVTPRHSGTLTIPSVLDPALLDAAFQALAPLLARSAIGDSQVPMPFAIQELTVYGSGLASADVECTLGADNPGAAATGDFVLRSPQGQIVASVHGLQIAWVDAGLLDAKGPEPAHILRTVWQAYPLPRPSADLGHWLLWTESGPRDQLVVDALIQQAIMLSPVARIDDLIGNVGASIAEGHPHLPRGVLLILAPEQTGIDPLVRCRRLCEQMQQLLLALSQQGLQPADMPVWLITRTAVARHPNEPIAIAQAGLIGMWRSAALEMPGLHLRHADLALAPTPDDVATLVLVLAGGGEFSVMVRDGYIYRPRLHQMEDLDNRGQSPIVLNANASYLITGGTGGIGPFVAEWLVGLGARHIVLASRQSQLTTFARARIAALGGAGVEVVVYHADLSQRPAVEKLVQDLSGGLYPLRGIIHAAGIVDDHALAAITDESWERVMAAKAQSAYWLLEATRGRSLDFFIGFSSIAATLGSPGQCNYATANALLDAVAAAYRADGRTVMTVNWGPWGEAGMASDPTLVVHLRRQGLYPLPPAAALAAMTRVLVSGADQTLIAAADWKRYQDSLPAAEFAALLQNVVAATLAPAVAPAVDLMSAQELLALTPAAAEDAILLGLGQLLRGVLRVDPSAQFPDQKRLAGMTLLSLGVDSLMAAELRNRVHAWLGVDVPAHVLISNDCIAQVAELIHGKVLLLSLSSGANDHLTTASEDTEVFVL